MDSWVWYWRKDKYESKITITEISDKKFIYSIKGFEHLVMSKSLLTTQSYKGKLRFAKLKPWTQDLIKLK